MVRGVIFMDAVCDTAIVITGGEIVEPVNDVSFETK